MIEDKDLTTQEDLAEFFAGWLDVFKYSLNVTSKIFDDYVEVSASNKDGRVLNIKAPNNISNVVPSVYIPYIGVLGKPVTEQRAFEIIAEHFPFKPKYVPRGYWELPFEVKYTDGYCLLNEWSLTNTSSGQYSWIHPNGEIGFYTFPSFRYPTIHEVMEQWFSMIAKIDGLDVVIGYTDFDGQPCYDCKIVNAYESISRISHELKSGAPDHFNIGVYNAELLTHKGSCACNSVDCVRCWKYLLSRNFGEVEAKSGQEWTEDDIDLMHYDLENLPTNFSKHIKLCIHIQGDECEFVAGDEAVKLYEEYFNNYGHGVDGGRVFSSRYNARRNNRIEFDEGFVKKCLTHIGVADSDLDLTYQNFIKRGY